MARSDPLELRTLLAAARHAPRAAPLIETAVVGRIQRAGHAAFEDDALPPGLRVGHGYGREQRVGVGVLRSVEERVAAGDLHDLAHIHDRHPVADVTHHGQVVGDEEVAQPQVVLQRFQQVDDLRLNAHVQRAHGLVADDELRIQGDGAGDADALPLAAGEFVGIAVRVFRRQADALQ